MGSEVRFTCRRERRSQRVGKILRSGVHSGEVLSSFGPESDPICLATRNNQSGFSAIPSVCGTSALEGGVTARLHGWTEWLADGISRPLPTHPHVHIVVG